MIIAMSSQEDKDEEMEAEEEDNDMGEEEVTPEGSESNVCVFDSYSRRILLWCK